MSEVEEADYNRHEHRFREEMKRRREGHGWSQGELADRMRTYGAAHANQMMVSRVEKGLRPIRMTEALAVAAAFGTTFDRFISRSEFDDYIDDLELYIAAEQRALLEVRRAADVYFERQQAVAEVLEDARTRVPAVADTTRERRELNMMIRRLEYVVEHPLSEAIAQSEARRVKHSEAP